VIVLSGDAQKHGCTGYLDEKEEFVENVVRSHELDVTLKLRLDVLKDWLDRVAVRVAWFTPHQHTTRQTRMWANAQRDGRPAEHRWRPLFNAAKFG